MRQSIKLFQKSIDTNPSIMDAFKGDTVLKDYMICMAGSRSDLIYRYRGTCDTCTRSTAAVEAAAAGALGADRAIGVHGNDDSK